MAVRPSPKRSIATPTRGEMSFQFCTVPTHPARVSFLPSAHFPNLMPLLKRLGGTSLSCVSPMN